MSSPSETPGTAGAAKEDASNRTLDDSEDGAWGAETDFDNLEKEASKIFALWEFAPADASAPAAPASEPATSTSAAEVDETWAPADTEVLPNAAPVEEPAASTLRDIAAPIVAAASAAAPIVAAPNVASVIVAAEPVATPIAFTAPAPAIATPTGLPDLPAVAPVRMASNAPPAAAAPAARVVAARPVAEIEEAPTLPSQPNYVLLVAAAVAILTLAGGTVGYFMVGSSNETPVAAATRPAPIAPTVAAPPPIAPAVPVAPAPVAVAPVAPAVPVVVAPVATAVAPVAPAPPPPPETHRLRVRITPSDATLVLDGVQVVNPLDREIVEGTHQLTASREGYEPASQEVDLSRSREVAIRLHAIPAPVVATAPAAPRTPPHTTTPRAPRTTTPRTTTPRTTTPRTTTGSGHGTFVTESPY
jgi:pyruvate dehydrogenase E2 component (dihydrolipoamide acetyltransferase)